MQVLISHRLFLNRVAQGLRMVNGDLETVVPEPGSTAERLVQIGIEIEELEDLRREHLALIKAHEEDIAEMEAKLKALQ